MNKEIAGKIRGVKIQTLNCAMIIAAAVLYLALVYATIQVSHRYEKLIQATEDYIKIGRASCRERV